MSGTTSEFDEPGSNYPDSAKESESHHRDDAGAGRDLLDDPPPEARTGTHDGPALDQNVTTDQERLDGILAQVRADVGGEDLAIVDRALRRRLADARVALDDDEIDRIAGELAGD